MADTIFIKTAALSEIVGLVILVDKSSTIDKERWDIYMGIQQEALTTEETLTLEQIKGQYFPVLDKGFVGLVDVMGNDLAIEQAARVSYGAGTRKVSDTRNLIRYLMRHKHTTPFEMAVFKFHVRVPMDCWRQLIRHRTASVNE